MQNRGVVPAKARRVGIGLVIALILVMVVASIAMTAQVEPTAVLDSPGLEPLPQLILGADGVAPAAVSADDGGAWELGLHGSAGNLTQATAAERAGMKYWLDGWFVTRYNYNENSAWEEDFKKASSGGTENNYLDTVDLQFYVGHGSPGRFTFDNATHDDGTLVAPTDCNASWGDGDNEWLALTSCQVLADSAIGNMAQCMNRQHLILGFVTNASAHNNYWDTQAYQFGRYMRYGYNMTQSWFKACDIAQRGKTTRVIAEETACFNDNPYYGSVCADVLDSDYYWYTHACGTETASYVDTQAMTLQMPVFRVNPYGLDEANQDFSRLGGVFSVPVTRTVTLRSPNEDAYPPPGTQGDTFLVAMDQKKTLELDKSSGIYQYSDLDQLWNDSQAVQALSLNAAAVNAINADDAKTIADAFLNSNGLMGDGSVFYEVVADTVGNLVKDSGVNGASTTAEEIAAAEVNAVWQVIYTRVLTAPVVTAAGGNADVTFTVVGPGAKQKVYVPVAAPVGAASVLATDPVGLQGGWRGVSPAISAASGEQIMADILDVETIKRLYLVLDKEVTMNSIPLDIKSRTILSHTLAYWESAPGNSQGELIPVYELKVSLVENGTDAISEDFAYVPASPIYMRPLARITNAPATGRDEGTPITLTAADANQTLKALGIGEASDNFNFVMGYAGSGGTYTYEWYLGEVTPENKITDLNTGDGPRNVTFSLPNVPAGHGDVVVVTLVVTDTDGPNRSVGTAAASILVNSKVFLPFSLK
ncbi:MAG: hypothetical protein KBG20_10010 [Caldilineaceae bacterium]|nr:hypothetical protein [Caldilineaceae bacterium]MBP8106996.1 hypothetical protein [Caldilineaceae bacterium]MBP8122010.1 hypothetical protein [Caldilineaceae bacterium]MBP9072625.1 hypothetical protein [Caldilineaceae bacterium]